MKYYEDPILGKGRAADVNGGTGGGGGTTYIAGDGLNLSGGTISANTATADELVSGTTVTKLVTANAYKTLNHAEPVVFSGSTASLAANTEFEFCGLMPLQKDDEVQVYFEFSGEFDSFDIAHVDALHGGMTLRVTATAIEFHYLNGTVVSYDHNLTLSTFVNLIVQKRFSAKHGDQRSTVTLSTVSGQNIFYDTPSLKEFGPFVFSATFAVTNLTANYVASDAGKKIWLFGDSYTMLPLGWTAYLPFNLVSNVAFLGYGGAGSLQVLPQLITLIGKTRPEYIIWAMGMNDADAEDTYSANWKSALEQVIQLCSANSVQLILVTIPNTPIRYHVHKDAYIHTLDYPIIDFAKAVNADYAEAPWYAGMLKVDNVHPTELGAKTLAAAFTQYFAQSFYLSDTFVTANQVTDDLRNDIYKTSPKWFPIETISSELYRAYLEPNHALKVFATNHSFKLFTVAMPPEQFGLEGFLEIFVGGGGYVQTDSNVILVDPLIPDAVNHCSVRFFDGYAYIKVEDHVAGYLVVNSSVSDEGSLYYGISTSTNDYVAFDVSLNGQSIPLAGAVAEGEKHIVGNGRTETILSGSFTGTSKTTLTNLSLSGSIVADGETELVNGIYHMDTVTGSAGLTIGSGAIIELTGNTNATPIAPGGGITFAQGGATVLYSSGSVSGSYMMDNVTLSAGAKLTNTAVVDFGGQFNRCYGGVSGATLTNGSLAIVSGGTANEITLNLSGYIWASSGGTAVNTTVNSSGTLVAGGGGTADNTTVNSSGKFYLYPGGIANNTTVSSGGSFINSGGTAVNTTVNGGNLLAISGGTVTNTTVNSSGSINIYSGGTAVEPIISSGGRLNVLSGGTAVNTTVNGGDTIISSGGTAVNTTVNGGNLYVREGTVTNTTMSSGGRLLVSSGGTAVEPIISSGGVLFVSSGASALLVTSNTGAIITVSAGGYITYKE